MSLDELKQLAPKLFSLLEAIEQATGLGGPLAEDITKAIHAAVTAAITGSSGVFDVEETITALKATIASNDARADEAEHAKFDTGGNA